MARFSAPALDAPTVEWAQWWADRGWQVFPLCSPTMGEHTHKKDGPVCQADIGKAPMVGAGFKMGTANKAQIKAWWTKWPTANIGATPPEAHFVVDIDGETDMEFPETWEHRTGKGRHLLYRDNITKPMFQGNRVWTNTDTRVSGKGYIVLPPSEHASGKRYEIVSQKQAIVFPAELVPDKKAVTKKATADNSEVIKLLTAPRDADELGDDAMSVVAGYLARYIPDQEHWSALIGALNLSLAEPLGEASMHKKVGIWEKHQASLVAKEIKAADDEARGWLFELGEMGYSTPIESKDNVDYMPWSDFRVQAKGLVIEPDSQVWIVDFQRADGSVLTNQRLNSHTLASIGKLREWLLNRGMILHDNAQDKRKHHGTRLVKLMQSQEPPVLMSRDYYGWCEKTAAFLTEDGEVTHDGIRSFTEVYPEDRLITDSPTAFRWDADLTQARDWLSRVLALQDEAESVKIGAWLMMLFLRGQWQGRLPGILVEASAGTGKTLFFQLLSKLAGTKNDGEEMSMPTARDQLAGNNSGFIWLDDVATNEHLEQLIRKAMTQGRVTKKEKGDNGRWVSQPIPLRGSVVISGEGTEFYRQKAMRDRFIEVEFQRNRSEDAERLMREDVGAGSGALLQAALGQAHLLDELDSDLRAGVTERDQQAQATLRIGARILDAVMEVGTKYTDLIDLWFSGKAKEADMGHASENVLNVFPSLWAELGYPHIAGGEFTSYPIWYDEVSGTFWINAKKVAELWNKRFNVSQRQRQLTDYAAVKKELDACEASESSNKRIPGSRQTVSYRQLPKRYADIVLKLADVNKDEEITDDDA